MAVEALNPDVGNYRESGLGLAFRVSKSSSPSFCSVYKYHKNPSLVASYCIKRHHKAKWVPRFGSHPNLKP